MTSVPPIHHSLHSYFMTQTVRTVTLLDHALSYDASTRCDAAESARHPAAEGGDASICPEINTTRHSDHLHRRKLSRKTFIVPSPSQPTARSKRLRLPNFKTSSRPFAKPNMDSLSESTHFRGRHRLLRDFKQQKA